MSFKYLKIQHAQCCSCGPSVHHKSVHYEIDELAEKTDLASSPSSLQTITVAISQRMLVEMLQLQQKTINN